LKKCNKNQKVDFLTPEYLSHGWRTTFENKNEE